MTPRELNNSEVHKEFDYRQFTHNIEREIKAYKRTFEKYISVAKEHNINLFLCDSFVNNACMDAAETLKIPVVGFSSYLPSMYYLQ